MAKYTITTTHNYGLFSLTNKNRPVDLDRRRSLRSSMKEHGFLKCYPMVCIRKVTTLDILDGQHRFMVAQELGLPVSYLVVDEDIDIAFVNSTQKAWNLSDYCRSFAVQGKPAYQELLDFSTQHDISLVASMGILANNISHSNVRQKYLSGEYEVKTRGLADRVARLYSGISEGAKHIRTRFFINALFATVAISGLDDERLLSGARRCPESLIKYGNRDAYLTMLEYIYNFGRMNKFPLKIEAENAMNKRNCGKGGDAK